MARKVDLQKVYLAKIKANLSIKEQKAMGKAMIEAGQ